MKQLNLYLNSDKPEGQQCLLRGASSMEAASSWIVLLGDSVTSRIWFLQASTTTGVAPSIIDILGDGESLMFGAKATSNLSGADFMFSQDTWTKNTDASGNTYYEGKLTFDSTALRDAFSNATQTQLSLTITVRIMNADQTERFSYQFACICYRSAILGTEGLPDTGNPVYPTAEQLAATLASLAPQGDIRIPDRDNNDALKRIVIKDGQIKFEIVE